MDFEIIPHTADLKIRAYGKTKEDLFVNSLIGMFQIIKPINDDCKFLNDKLVCPNLPFEHEIKLNSSEVDLLLVDFLNQALYLSDINNEAYLDVKIKNMTDASIEALLKGIKVQGFEIEIKAVTYHDLKIEFENGYWMTDIVFDI